MDIRTILDFYKIEYFEKGRNVSEGWINIQCPFCGDTSNHGGFNLENNYYNCWRCGYHRLEEVFEALNIPKKEIFNLIKKLSFSDVIRKRLNKKEEIKQEEQGKEEKKLELKLIGRDLIFVEQAKKYLEKRNFSPIFLQKKYNLKATGYIGDWKYRIIIPVFFKNQLVTFIGRDYTDQQPLRYRNLEKEKSLMSTKEILYNLDNCNKNKVIVTEGCFDVWRIGNDCCCGFGLKLTKKQLNLLDRFNEIFFCFDFEEEAIRQAKVYANYLAGLGKKVRVVTEVKNKKDLAELTDNEAIELKRELGFL